jgi:hypothetical protein
MLRTRGDAGATAETLHRIDRGVTTRRIEEAGTLCCRTHGEVAPMDGRAPCATVAQIAASMPPYKSIPVGSMGVARGALSLQTDLARYEDAVVADVPPPQARIHHDVARCRFEFCPRVGANPARLVETNSSPRSRALLSSISASSPRRRNRSFTSTSVATSRADRHLRLDLDVGRWRTLSVRSISAVGLVDGLSAMTPSP